MPDVEQGSPADFFDAVDAEIGRGAPVPVWRGELYFETHRGTLTSQLRTKLGNRRCERLLREAELWTALAGDGDPHELDELWQEVLTQQFHDIIPGLVDRLGARRRRGRPRPHRRRARGRASRRRSGGSLRPGRCWPTSPRATATRSSSPTSRPTGDGPTQALADGRIAFRARVPGLGLAPAVAVATDDRVVVTDRSMANGRLAVAWDLDGNLRSVIDVARARELLPAGAARRGARAGSRPPGALRRVGPRVVGARRPGAAHGGRRASRSSSAGRSSARCGCGGRSGRRRRR